MGIELNDSILFCWVSVSQFTGHAGLPSDTGPVFSDTENCVM